MEMVLHMGPEAVHMGLEELHRGLHCHFAHRI